MYDIVFFFNRAVALSKQERKSEWNPPKLYKPPFLGYILVRLFGLEICPECHSRDVKQEGWEDYHHRHHCSRCKKTFMISGWD